MTAMLSGQVAIVTGAGGGVGGAIAALLAQNGALVVACDMRHHDATADRIVAAGGIAEAMTLDVSRQDSIDALVGDVQARHGRIDILVNAAGVFDPTPAADVGQEEWGHVLGVNVIGLAAMSQAVVPAMTAQGSGRIINIASTAGRRADSRAMVYSASKAAAISVTQAFALALAPTGIRVNAIAPGAVQTAMWEGIDRRFSEAYLDTGPGGLTALVTAATPTGAIATPDDIAGTALFLASPHSSHIVGQTINVDGGVALN